MALFCWQVEEYNEIDLIHNCYFMENCTMCGQPMAEGMAEGHACSCQPGVCINCCSCEPGCEGCGKPAAPATEETPAAE